MAGRYQPMNSQRQTACWRNLRVLWMPFAALSNSANAHRARAAGRRGGFAGDSPLEEDGYEPSVPPWGQDLTTPARRRLRCQSRASSSSACFGGFCPSKASDITVRSEISSASHTGCAGVGNPVSIASAATGGQPSFATIVGSRSTEPRGGALPRSMERSIHCLLHAMRMSSSDQFGYFAYFGIERKWPSIQVWLSALLV